MTTRLTSNDPDLNVTPGCPVHGHSCPVADSCFYATQVISIRQLICWGALPHNYTYSKTFQCKLHKLQHKQNKWSPTPVNQKQFCLARNEFKKHKHKIFYNNMCRLFARSQSNKMYWYTLRPTLRPSLCCAVVPSVHRSYCPCGCVPLEKY